MSELSITPGQTASCRGQGRRRSVDLRFFRPTLNSHQIAVTRGDEARFHPERLFVEPVLNSSFSRPYMDSEIETFLLGST